MYSDKIATLLKGPCVNCGEWIGHTDLCLDNNEVTEPEACIKVVPESDTEVIPLNVLEKPGSDFLRDRYENWNCHLNVGTGMFKFSPPDSTYQKYIDLRSENLAVWEVLYIIDTKGFDFKDFQIYLKGTWYTMKPNSVLTTFLKDDPIRFKWEKSYV
jgi:hypothetical protein